MGFGDAAIYTVIFAPHSSNKCGSGEMADTQVLGTCASACGFKSHLPHQL
jgi:hypothetical protein